MTTQSSPDAAVELTKIRLSEDAQALPRIAKNEFRTDGEVKEGEEENETYGWKIRLDHEFVSKAGPLKMIRPKQIPSLLSTFVRYR